MKKSAAEKQGGIAGACALDDGDGLLVVTKAGQVIRIDTDDIRETGRTATGVRIVKLADGDEVGKIARLQKVEVVADIMKV
jgi:DNA gyrase subunit A